MSVLQCDRPGCESIMCDNYSPMYGYICSCCMAEYSQGTWTTVAEFMDSHKNNQIQCKEDIFEVFTDEAL